MKFILRGDNIDLLLASVCEIAKSRPEFRIVAMSATVDPEVFKNFFIRSGLKYQLYEIEGIKSIHKVTDIFSKQPVKNLSDYQKEPMVKKVIELLKNIKLVIYYAF